MNEFRFNIFRIFMIMVFVCIAWVTCWGIAAIILGAPIFTIIIFLPILLMLLVGEILFIIYMYKDK